jgi:hypothetical protein
VACYQGSSEKNLGNKENLARQRGKNEEEQFQIVYPSMTDQLKQPIEIVLAIGKAIQSLESGEPGAL